MNRNSNHRTLVMGIVNVTPDSFSDGGRFLAAKDAIQHAYELIEQGADVLDIGGESTRPNFDAVSTEEEWQRVEPVLKELVGNCPVPISVDTYKAAIASKAIELGAAIINDIWGGMHDSDMLRVVAEAGCDYIWMHNRETVVDDSAFTVLVDETRQGVTECLLAGIKPEHLWIDPGIGFGKTYQANLRILKRLQEYCQFGYPVLLGTSRKSVIGNTLNTPPEERLEGSLATVALGVWAGVRCVRVHDVKETVRVCRMVEAISDVDG